MVRDRYAFQCFIRGTYVLENKIVKSQDKETLRVIYTVPDIFSQLRIQH